LALYHHHITWLAPRAALSLQMRLVSVPEMGYHVGGLGPARGELCLRGPCLFSGYYKQADATREVGAPGWACCGD
jgi:long-chain acyl-CoA synthetase